MQKGAQKGDAKWFVRSHGCAKGSVQKEVCKRRCAKGYKLPSDLNLPPPLPQKLVTPPPCLCACPGVVLDIREGQRGPFFQSDIFFGGRTLTFCIPHSFLQHRATFCIHPFFGRGGSPPPKDCS